MRTGGPGKSAGPARSASPASWWAWLWWFVVGALVGVGVVSILTIGAALLLLALVLALVAIRVRALRTRAAAATIAGIGAAALWLAWLNRDGPGMVCHPIAAGTECGEQWNPWPFVVVGLLLVASSVVLERVLARRQPGSA